MFVDDDACRCRREYVKNNEIVLNIGFEATSALKLGNEFIEFKARFGGTAREIIVPVDHVIAIYARENGQGMAFPVPRRAPASAEARRRVRRLARRAAARAARGRRTAPMPVTRRRRDDADAADRRPARAARRGGRARAQAHQVDALRRGVPARLECRAIRRLSSVGRATAL